MYCSSGQPVITHFCSVFKAFTGMVTDVGQVYVLVYTVWVSKYVSYMLYIVSINLLKPKLFLNASLQTNRCNFIILRLINLKQPAFYSL